MNERRFDEKYIPIDILRMIVNKARVIPVTLLVCGHPQMGKSTFDCYLGNRIMQIRRGIPMQEATWREWDYKKYTSLTPQEFVSNASSNSDKFIAMEEAGEQMNYLEWWGTMSQVFDSQVRTQGYLKNIYSLITPKSTDVVKHNKEHIDFKLWVIKRNDKLRYAKVRPRWLWIDYIKDKSKFMWVRDWDIVYPQAFLDVAREYTRWLVKYKEGIAEKNKEKVGLKKKKKPVGFCYRCGSIHAKGECPLSPNGFVEINKMS